MREASHGGTRPPCKGRSALPVRFAIRPRYPILCHLGATLDHRPEGDGVAFGFDGRNAVFPYRPRLAGHHVDRTGLRFEGETLELGRSGPAKSELAYRAQRQAEDPVEVRLVPVPTDPNADVVFGAEDLLYSRTGSTESLDAM